MIGVVIIGAGQGGTSLLRAFAHMPQIRVLGVADRDEQAPGIALARQLGIPTHTDFQTLISRADVEIIVQATGQPELDRDIARLKWPRASIVEGLTMKLLLSLVAEAEDLVRRLKERERERDIILNSTHDGFLAVGARGEVTLLNAAAERLMGLVAAEVLGRPAAEVIPGTRLHIVLKTGRAELNQQQKMNGTTIVTNRVPVRDSDGRIVGAVAVFRDITEVKALAEELTNSKEIQGMLEAIVSSTQDAIQVVDAKGRCVLINSAYTQITGLAAEQVIGQPATVDIAEGESMHMQVLRTGKPVRGVTMKVGPRRRDVVVTCTPIMVGGELKGSVGVVRDVSEIARLSAELDQVQKLVRRLTARYTFDDIIARSPAMQQVVEQARRAAATPATVLLRGESGTGKELFAHAIHNLSARRGGPFIRVNCAALTDTLLESELFGYVEGAFTGASKGGRRGLFEGASGGTLFLDEIGEMSLHLQAKLLRVLQEKEIIRVGANKPAPVDVRVIAATNANLEEAVAGGRFREDLYYRLAVVPILIPPLRQRREDIAELARHVVDKYNREYGRHVEEIAPAAMARLQAYAWPGNVREMENVIGRAMIHMGIHATVIEERYLPALGATPGPAAAPAATGPGEPAAATAPAVGGSLAEVVAAAERAAILAALDAEDDNRLAAARRLGISSRTLYYKMQRLGLGEPRT